MNTLERWRAEGKLEFLATFRLEMEVARYDKAQSKIAVMRPVSEPMVLDESVWGECYLADVNDPGPEFVEIASVLFPGKLPLTQNDRNDTMHVLSHVGAKGDIFITRDGAILRNRDLLRSQWKIVVMTDDEAVEHLQSSRGWA